ncbi:MAG: Rab family GTPase [Promethearchaeota archaeon]|jgi:Ras-related protein Rab-1A
MGLIRKWKRKRELKRIPLELIYDTLYQSLKSFNEDIPISIKLSIKKYPIKDLIKQEPKVVKAVKDVIYRSDYRRIYRDKLIIRKPSGIKNILSKSFYDATYKIILFGDCGTGKATLTQKYLTNLFKSDTRMTIGVDFNVKSVDIDDKHVKLQIWDFGGEERYRFLLPTYVRGAHGALFIYDVNNPDSLAHIDDWLLVIRKEIKSEKEKFPIIVVGVILEREEQERVPSEEGINIARSRGVDGFIECSPITGENVEETFETLTRLMLAKSSH